MSWCWLSGWGPRRCVSCSPSSSPQPPGLYSHNDQCSRCSWELGYHCQLHCLSYRRHSGHCVAVCLCFCCSTYMHRMQQFPAFYCTDLQWSGRLLYCWCVSWSQDCWQPVWESILPGWRIVRLCSPYAQTRQTTVYACCSIALESSTLKRHLWRCSANSCPTPDYWSWIWRRHLR